MRQMILAQTVMETRMLLRNGEQLTVTMVIPLALLAMFSLEPLVSVGAGSRIDFLAPGIIALAIMSTAFTSQAIATGFERRYGVLKRLGAEPLSRVGLISAKTISVILVELLQAVLITAIAFGLGWSPHARALAFLTVPLLVLAGTAAFSGLALLMAGALRAEATLALANLIYIALLGLGGVVFPLTKFPAGRAPLPHPAAHRGPGHRAAVGAGPRGRVPGAGPDRAGGVGRAGHRPGGPHVPLGVSTEVRDPGARGSRGSGDSPGARGSRGSAGRAGLSSRATAGSAALVLGGIVSTQIGAGLAARLFHQVPPAVVTGLRLWAAAIVLLIVWRPAA